MQVVELVGEVLYGVEKPRKIQIERNNHTCVESEFHTKPERHRNGTDVQKRYERTVYAERKHDGVSRFAQIFVLL